MAYERMKEGLHFIAAYYRKDILDRLSLHSDNICANTDWHSRRNFKYDVGKKVQNIPNVIIQYFPR